MNLLQRVNAITKQMTAIAWLSLGLSSCNAPQTGVPAEGATLEKMIDHQAKRARLLLLLRSSGTIELRTKDEDGESFNDCALELWRDGDLFALRLRKLGERFLWVGSDGINWWVFALASDPVEVVVYPVGKAANQSIDPESALLAPSEFLQLTGLLAVEALGGPAQSGSADGLGWADVRSAPGSAWHRMRWHYDQKTLLPKRIQAFDEADLLLVEVRLDGYEPIPARDTPIGAWPAFARKIRITKPDGSVDLRLFFNGPNARGEGLRRQLFEFDQLIRTFRPQRIEHVRSE